MTAEVKRNSFGNYKLLLLQDMKQKLNKFFQKYGSIKKKIKNQANKLTIKCLKQLTKRPFFNYTEEDILDAKAII